MTTEDLDRLEAYLGSAKGDDICPVYYTAGTIRGLIQWCRNLRQQLAAAQKFKAWVHDYLDRRGVPEDPDPEGNAKHGCRISGRMEWLMQQLAAAPAWHPKPTCAGYWLVQDQFGGWCGFVVEEPIDVPLGNWLGPIPKKQETVK